MQTLQSMAAIIAVTQLIKQIFPAQISGALTIIVAVVLGALAGYAKIDGLTILTGVFAALAAVGVHTTATAIRG